MSLRFHDQSFKLIPVSYDCEVPEMINVKRLFTGMLVMLVCLFMSGAPALAEGQGGEGQGLNEAGDIYNAAQYFNDTAEHFIIGRNVRCRDTAEIRDDNIAGEYEFGEPVQIVAEVSFTCKI